MSSEENIIYALFVNNWYTYIKCIQLFYTKIGMSIFKHTDKNYMNILFLIITQLSKNVKNSSSLAFTCLKGEQKGRK